MLPALLLFACHDRHPAPDRGHTDETGATPPSTLQVALGPERVWSAEAPAFDQHHATTVALPFDGPPPAGAPAGVVTWTDRELWESPACLLQAVDADGVPVGPSVELHDGAVASKPDIDVDPDGRLVVAYQSDLGIGFERTDPAGASHEQVVIAGNYAAEGNNSVDLAVRSDGTTLMVWFEEQPPVARYRTAALGSDLVELPLLPPIVAEVVDTAPSTPDIDLDRFDRPTVAWVDQHADVHDQLMLTSYEADGAERWTVQLDDTTYDDAARRATVTIEPEGAMAVAWNRRSIDLSNDSTLMLAFVDPDGGWLREPFEPFEGNDDGVVATMVGADAVWVAWTDLGVAPVEQVGTIRAALLSFPAGELLQGPLTLSTSAVAYRAHTDVAPQGADRYGLVVSWEEDDADGVRVVKGRAGVISLQGP